MLHQLLQAFLQFVPLPLQQFDPVQALLQDQPVRRRQSPIQRIHARLLAGPHPPVKQLCRPDLILLDLGLPDEVGFEVIRRLRQTSQTLVRHAGKVVTQRQLLVEVWGPQHSEQAQYLRVYMAQLRRKLENDPARPRHLRTEPGVGYRLVAG